MFSRLPFRSLSPQFMLLVASTCVILMLVVTPSRSQAFPLDQDDLLEDLAQYSPPWFSELQDVELDGDRAYVFGVGGMAIFDITDPNILIELGRYEPIGHPWNRFYRGATNGTIACGGGRADLLTIMDVSDPTLPTALAFYGAPGQSFEGMAMRGSYIYACRHGEGLEIIDITTPALPTSAAQVTSLTNAWDVTLSGDIAYVADGAGGLAVVDITNPAAPFLITSVPTSGAAVDVEVSGTTVVVAVGSAGLDIFDVSTPSNPLLVSTANTSGLAITAAIAGDIVYVADWDDVEAFDISNPAFPTPAGGEDTPVRAMGLAARPGLVVVADWSRLRLYQIGPSTRNDIQVSVEEISFGFVPLGAVVDTTFTIGNTGGAILNINGISDFGANFQIMTPGPFAIPVGGSVDITVRYTRIVEGFEATFIRIDSDDNDEAIITFPVNADDDPYWLNIGDAAHDWTYLDRDGVTHQLSSYQGRIVVMAFFANW